MDAKVILAFVSSAVLSYAAVTTTSHQGLREVTMGGKVVSDRGLNIDGTDYVPVEDVAKFTGTRVEFDELFGRADLWPEPKGSELVKNGDFESGPSIELSMEEPTDIPGWDRKDGAAVMRITGQSTGFIDTRKLKRQGRQFFSGGKGQEPSITQTIDLKAYTPKFAGGKVVAVFQSDVGSYDAQNDGAIVTLDWMNQKGQKISGVQITGPTRALRDFTSRFYRVFVRSKVPEGTASAKIRVLAIGDRSVGIWMDGWTDNVSLRLDIPK